jgi:glycosyltransferase involved in cell wall biosynthesis
VNVSIILPTVGRSVEVARFLSSLTEQTYCEFEVIVVDQNPDDRLANVIGEFESQFSIRHLRSPKGKNRALNAGFNCCTGEIIAIPDDDCEYLPSVLKRVVNFFSEDPKWHGLSGRCVDEQGEPSTGRCDMVAGPIGRYNIWRRQTAAALFFRRELIQLTGPFDEDLGPGAGTPWVGGEETRYSLRALEKGLNLYYDPDLLIYHPQRVVNYDEAAAARHFMYGMGVGRCLRIHNYRLSYVMSWWIRPLGGSVIALLRGDYRRAYYHWKGFEGRFRGWLAARPHTNVQSR